ncbi:Ig-like domain-containing alpha-2-macroglobulin family protein [Persicimonas caeni]|nr:Ig-like domain-containing alpha-2-macroglobulin family protein [Persicimonas caeni]
MTRITPLLVAALLITSCALTSCSQSPSLSSPEEDPSAYSAFPSTGGALQSSSDESSGEESEALEVVMKRPTDEVTSSSVVTVSFNQAMVEPSVGEVEADAPIFQIEPKLAGTYHWMGSRTAVFHPKEELPKATHFKVTVPAGTESLDGNALAQDYTFGFRTPFLQVSRVRSHPDYRKLRPEGEIRVFLNLEVDPEDFEEAVTLEEDGVEIAKVVEGRETKGYYGKDSYAIKRPGGFRLGSRYHLRIDGSLTPKGGNATLSEGIEQKVASMSPSRRRSAEKNYRGGDYHAQFDAYGHFQVDRVRCGWRDCDSHSSWRVEFSNPLDKEDVEECVSVSGGAKLSSVSASRDTLYINPSNVKGGKTYKLRVDRGCKDIFGNTLAATRTYSIEVDYPSPMISVENGLRILEVAKGSEAPAIPVTLRNAKNATVRMYEVPEDQLAYVSANLYDVTKQTGKPFKGRLGSGTQYKIGTNLRTGQTKSYAIDLGRELGNKPIGAVYFDVDSPDVQVSYGNSIRQGLVVVTDLGITIKEAGDENLVWVTGLSDGKPVADAKVSLWAANGKRLWTGKTDEQGLVTTPAGETIDSNSVVALTAKKGADTSLIDLDSWRGTVWPYRFRLDYREQRESMYTRNFIFTERGVYRTGETVHVKGYMRLEKDGELQKMPAERAVVTVANSRGENVAREEVELSKLGGYSLDVKLPDNAALGTYSVSVAPIDPDVSKQLATGRGGSFRVEAYRTPEFEVLVEPENDEMIVGRDAKATVRGRYLFGAPMRNNQAYWTARRSRARFEPQNFKEYNFNANRWRYWWYYDSSSSRHLSSASGKLDDEGALEAAFEVPEDEDFSGPQEIVIEAEVTDVNRQRSSGRATIRVHPGEYYVGVKQPNYLVKAGESISPKAVAVDYDGKALSGKPVQMRVLRREWKSVKKKSAGGGYTWVTEHEDKEVGACKLTSGAAPKGCDFKIDGSGSYVVEVKSTDGLGNELVSTAPFYAYGGDGYWWGRSDDERIDLIADKKEYEVGDTAKIMVQSPFEEAHALVTVERGGVLERFTTAIDGTSSVVEVPITPKMQPNAYVSVSLVRGRVALSADERQRAKDEGADLGRPAFKIGYVELTVDHSERQLDVAVAPDSLEYRPGGLVRADISVRDHEGRPTAGEVTFMAVDQGVLSLTGYKTPNPVDAFFKERPLGVKNRDSRLMLTTRAELEKKKELAADKSAEGGDGSGMAMNYRSEFATTATYRAKIDVDDSGQATVEFRLPENLTAYRLMAVAVAEGNRFGSGDKRVEVNKPLMARPALPRFASTGDKFEARVVVQSMVETAGKVSVDVEIDGPLELTGDKTKTITLPAGAAKEVAFPVTAGVPGAAKVRFAVRGQGELAGEDAVELELPVRYPAAEQSFVETGTVTMDSSWSQADVRRRLELPKGIRKDVGGLEIELSSSALGELLPGLEYLVDYPYGCAEQTTGRTLPLVSMRDTVGDLELPGLRSDDIGKFAQSGLDRLLNMQTRDGGLGYWPGASSAHPWTTTYGGLALVRAKKLGDYDINADRYSKLLGYLSNLLRGKVSMSSHWHREAVLTTQAFASWVLAEAGEPQPSYHTRLADQRHLMPRFAQALLALAIHESGDSPEVRDALMDDLLSSVVEKNGIAHLTDKKPSERHWWMIWHSRTRADAMTLLALLRIRPNDPLIPKFAQGLLQTRQRGRWQNTQDTAFAVMALSEYFERAEAITPDYRALVGVGDTEFAREEFTKAELRPRRIFIPMEELAKRDGKLLTIARRGAGGPMYYTATLTYVQDEPPTTGFDGGFHLQRDYVAADGDNAGEPLDKVRPGQVVKVQLTLTVPEERSFVAVEDPLPAGFEPINTDFKTTSTNLDEALGSSDRGRWYWWSWYWWARFDHTEQHDDKVLLFANRMRPGVYKHAYLARATTPGTFTAPAARAEAMYEPALYGRSDAKAVEIR